MYITVDLETNENHEIFFSFAKQEFPFLDMLTKLLSQSQTTSYRNIYNLNLVSAYILRDSLKKWSIVA